MASDLIPNEIIQAKIYFLRAKKVMIDRDLAELYGVTTKAFNQAVRRNIDRFPSDFMFQMSKDEYAHLRSQFVTSSSEHGGVRYLPCVFTEQGVAMLSSVLRSKRAISVNIQIMRTFTQLREMYLENDQLRLKVELMERQYDEQFKIVFDAIKRLIVEEQSPKPEIGFRAKKKV